MRSADEEEADREVRRQMARERRHQRAAAAELDCKLRALMPYPVGTWALIIANALIFIAMVASGVGATHPSARSLLDWGASYGPRTTGGEWWRGLTAMFVHIGVLHLAMNMFVLWDVGSRIERLRGSAAFILLYLVSGWAGSVLSVLTNPTAVGAGASGAIYGIYGVLLAFLLRRGASVALRVLRPFGYIGSTWLGILIIANFVLSLRDPRIGVAAHVGGFACGFICGALADHEVSREARKAMRLRTVAVVAAAAALSAFAMIVLHRPVPDLAAIIDHLIVMEDRIGKVRKEASDQMVKGNLTDDEYAAIIERDVLPPCRAMSDELVAVRNAPSSQKSLIAQFQKYQSLRQEGWQLMVHGLRERRRSVGSGAFETRRSRRSAARIHTKTGRYYRGRVTLVVTAPFPTWLEPMAATLTRKRFTGPDWVFERKLDGIRLLALKDGGKVRLMTRITCRCAWFMQENAEFDEQPRNQAVRRVRERLFRRLVRDVDAFPTLLSGKRLTTVHISDQAITVEPKETVLQAALRSGIDFPNSCRVGGCGTCKCKLSRGRTSKWTFRVRPRSVAGRIVEQTKVTHDITRLTVQLDQPRPYKAGQFANLSIDGLPGIVRSYSFAS